MEMEQHIPAIPAEYNRMFYEQQARRTIDPTTRLMMHYRFLMMRKYVPRTASDILEIGPGDGELSLLLASEGFHYTAVDIAAERLASWGSRNQSAINKVAADVTRGLPFADNAFDVVLCGEVIEHLPNYREVLQDIYRILKPGGKVVLTVPFEETLKYVVCPRCGHLFEMNGHVNTFSVKSLSRDLKDAKLSPGRYHIGHTKISRELWKVAHKIRVLGAEPALNPNWRLIPFIAFHTCRIVDHLTHFMLRASDTWLLMSGRKSS